MRSLYQARDSSHFEVMRNVLASFPGLHQARDDLCDDIMVPLPSFLSHHVKKLCNKKLGSGA